MTERLRELTHCGSVEEGRILTRHPFWYRFDEELFNQRKLKTQIKVHIDVLDEILYADDKDKVNG